MIKKALRLKALHASDMSQAAVRTLPGWCRVLSESEFCASRDHDYCKVTNRRLQVPPTWMNRRCKWAIGKTVDGMLLALAGRRDIGPVFSIRKVID